VTGTTRDAIVGQKMNLSVQVQPSGTQLTNTNWSVPGMRVGNYAVDPSGVSAQVVPFTDTTTTSISFYWVDEGYNRTVSLSGKVNGVSVSAYVIFDAKRPVVTVTSETGEVGLSTVWDNALTLHFGSPSLIGINLNRTFYSPPSGFSGNTFWVQVIAPLRRRQLADGTWQKLTGAGLDGHYPYSSITHAGDNPRQPIDNSRLQYVANDTATMWLMFQPSLANSIPVPLLKVDWSWYGAIENRGGGNWVLTARSNTVNPPPVATTEFPQWSQLANDSVWVNE